jgi:sensor histidine kinase YesM
LKQLRFENRFTYHINTDSLEASDFITIPPMLIQPFIENAILHGFKNKTEGKLDLKFIEKEEYIICEINDNGIGRKASDVQQLNKKHKSLATTITEDRLQTLSKELNKPAFFKIEDKIDKVSQEALGTKVTIQIPYSEN